MPVTKLPIKEFITFVSSGIVLDVRSPGEFAHAHIPGAQSLGIFNDEERKIIGTAYKQESREKAIKLGLDFFGPKMVKIVEATEALLDKNKITTKTVGLHCWRGGMRSGAVAWLLNLYGFDVYLLEGGYKSYRHWVLKQFEEKYNLQIVGGYSGSDKTGVLSEFKKRGQAVIDLEALAGHQGSAFGNLEALPQPGQEQFENLLAQELFKYNDQKTIWLEAESQRIGNVNIPLPFLETMHASPVLFLNIPFEMRLSHILSAYGKHEKASIINGIIRIKKRLGGLETKTAINFLLEDDLKNCFAILLHYYDKVYLKSTLSRDNAEQLITYIDSETLDRKLNMTKISEHVGNRQ